MIQFVHADIQYDRKRIFRRLHIEPDTYIHEYCTEIFPRLAGEVAEKLHMLNCFRVLDKPVHFGIPDIDECRRQIVCLCSCGSEILDASNEWMEKGDYLEGYMLNDLTSEILFNASDYMNRQVEAQMEAIGHHLTRRYSPGEGGMSLTYQKELLGCFQGEPSLEHIHLTDRLMLVPEKSMLYVFGADPDKPKRSITHDCGQCPNTGCFFRLEGGNNYFCE